MFKRYLSATLDGDPTLERRLQVMIQHRPAQWREAGSGHMTLAWPAEIVLEDGRFAGLLMPVVDMAETVGLHRVTNPTDRRSATGPTSWAQAFTWRYLVTTAANLAHATHVLHESGVVIGDFNESNIRAWRQARVTLLDCDSMQISDPGTGERFFCPVGRPEFTPPELLGADWAVTLRHPTSDLFALAVHLYQLLLEGEHPFRGVWRDAGEKPPVPELARQGIWAHQDGGPLTPRPAAIGASLLPPAIVDMFRRAFEDGAVNPSARPAALEWHSALTGLAGELRQCTTREAHFYPGSLQDCPWCQYVPPPAPVSLRAPPASRQPFPGTLPPGWGVPRRQPVRRGLARRLPGRGIAITAGAIILALVGAVIGFRTADAGPSPLRTLSDPASPTSTAGGIKALAYGPGGKTLVTGDEDGSAYLWNVATGRITTTFTDPDGGGELVAAISPDGKTLATGDQDGNAYLWDIATGRLAGTLASPGRGNNSSYVEGLAFSPDGTTLAVANGSSAYLWDVATRRITATFTDRNSNYVTAVAFSPDGTMLATGDDNGSAYLWDLGTRRLTTTLTDPDGGGLWSVAFSPDDMTLALGDNNGATLWYIPYGQLNATYTDPRSAGGQAVAFSPDGNTLAVGDGNGSAYLWDVATGHITTTVTDPEAQGLEALAFSPNGETLVTGDDNGSAYLWDARPPRK